MTVVHETGIGPLYLDASDDGLTLVGFTEPAVSSGAGPSGAGSRAVLDLARREIDAYLAGTLRAFTVPVDLTGLPAAHRRVLHGLDDVGWGATITYGDLARRVGLPVTDSRRVGGAMARNPVAVVVPCHRVVGADGSLTGYAGGLAVKRTLLDLEAADAMLF
ncbi:methylated-DNA--[protein]-cysteine S-methyltransferase [Actinomycetospora atypica]|uniref:Methylated-DNA--[protein]-cysteine S-methyltransferase n=1 Tax=Actinomycetospora atypica TaxID=1290095 RepID=A0ABV9YW42_9PSEU